MSERWERVDTLVYALTEDAKGRMVNRWYANVQSAGQPHEAAATERCAIATKMRAAPDMLAALEGFASWEDRIASDGLLGEGDLARLILLVDEARRAIAKARGQGPSSSEE